MTDTTTHDLLADLIHEQQKTRYAITQLAEALAGVRHEVTGEEPAVEAATAVEEAVAEEPAAPEAEDVTLADLRQTFADLSKSGKKGALRELLLAKHGETKLTNIDQEHYAELKREALAL